MAHLGSTRTVSPPVGALSSDAEGEGVNAYEGNLDSDAARVINTACGLLMQALTPAGLETHALPPPALEAAANARALAQLAQQESDPTKKMVLAAAASYSAQFFGLPRNTLAYTLDQVFGMYAMSASQRRAIHQQAAAALDLFVATKKGAAMSGTGVFRDGILGSAMFQPGSFRDGSLGVVQNGAFRDGSLGAYLMNQPGVFRDGSLGRVRRRALRGLGGGCGCSGMGADAAVATETPIYKKPLVIGGAAVALGVVLFVATRKKR